MAGIEGGKKRNYRMFSASGVGAGSTIDQPGCI
jgi:hypothetical protein